MQKHPSESQAWAFLQSLAPTRSQSWSASLLLKVAEKYITSIIFFDDGNEILLGGIFRCVLVTVSGLSRNWQEIISRFGRVYRSSPWKLSGFSICSKNVSFFTFGLAAGDVSELKIGVGKRKLHMVIAWGNVFFHPFFNPFIRIRRFEFFWDDLFILAFQNDLSRAFVQNLEATFFTPADRERSWKSSLSWACDHLEELAFFQVRITIIAKNINLNKEDFKFFPAK
jgi:hypothetical protein